MRVVTLAERPVHSRAEADSIAERIDPRKGVTLGIQLPDGQVAAVPIVEPNFSR
jgi:hypothetical protein